MSKRSDPGLLDALERYTQGMEVSQYDCTNMYWIYTVQIAKYHGNVGNVWAPWIP